MHDIQGHATDACAALRTKMMTIISFEKTLVKPVVTTNESRTKSVVPGEATAGT